MAASCAGPLARTVLTEEDERLISVGTKPLQQLLLEVYCT